MKHFLSILFVVCVCMRIAAQTPYDSFAPETSRPILDMEALSEMHIPSLQSPDTMLCALVIDTSQEQIYLVNISDGEIIAYAPITDDIRKWMSVDPLADKYPNISPYAYCHWNPINIIDPDGMDDLFNELGVYLEHIDNGTDYVIIRQANGEEQNITKFSYNLDETQNREMLSNVASFYASQVGINQTIGLIDDVKGGSSAIFGTLSKKTSMVVQNGVIHSDANTASNIMNSLAHEKVHIEKGTSGAIAEVEAIVAQIGHFTWSNTTDSYKAGIVDYLVNNANTACQNNPSINVNSIIAPIMPILDFSPYSVFLNNGTYSIFLNPIIK